MPPARAQVHRIDFERGAGVKQHGTAHRVILAALRYRLMDSSPGRLTGPISATSNWCSVQFQQ